MVIRSYRAVGCGDGPSGGSVRRSRDHQRGGGGLQGVALGRVLQLEQACSSSVVVLVVLLLLQAAAGLQQGALHAGVTLRRGRGHLLGGLIGFVIDNKHKKTKYCKFSGQKDNTIT